MDLGSWLGVSYFLQDLHQMFISVVTWRGSKKWHHLLEFPVMKIRYTRGVMCGSIDAEYRARKSHA